MSNSTSSNGIGLTGVLFIVFLVLKLTNVIDWSWWWVTCPLWAGGVIAIGAMVLLWVLELAYKAGKKSVEQKPATHTSKFMQKLEEAKKASEEKRKQTLN